MYLVARSLIMVFRSLLESLLIVVLCLFPSRDNMVLSRPRTRVMLSVLAHVLIY
eukprot:SAG11_NODE_1330_length_5187_cov_6.700079_1_plen_53_part_10